MITLDRWKKCGPKTRRWVAVRASRMKAIKEFLDEKKIRFRLLSLKKVSLVRRF